MIYEPLHLAENHAFLMLDEPIVVIAVVKISWAKIRLDLHEAHASVQSHEVLQRHPRSRRRCPAHGERRGQQQTGGTSGQE